MSHLTKPLDDDNRNRDPFDSLDDIIGQNLCIVCKVHPAYSKNGKTYPTCGLSCMRTLEQAQANVLQQPMSDARRSSSNRMSSMYSNTGLPVFHTQTRNALSGRESVGGLINNMANLSLQRRGANSSGSLLPRNLSTTPRTPPTNRLSQIGNTSARGRVTGAATTTTAAYQDDLEDDDDDSSLDDITGHDLCVVCERRPAYSKNGKRYPTCGPTCANRLMQPPAGGTQGRSYVPRSASEKPMLYILAPPDGQMIHEQVEKKFLSAWKYPETPIPAIKKVYKIREDMPSLWSYHSYKAAHGNKDVYRYYGTSRGCTLGSVGNTKLCKDSKCALCSILKSSFKTSLANLSGAFGTGVYTSSASNKAYGYTCGGTGVVLLTKVVLGRMHYADASGEVSSCPAGYDSVVFDRHGSLNETIIYTENAIRPVFLIVF